MAAVLRAMSLHAGHHFAPTHAAQQPLQLFGPRHAAVAQWHRASRGEVAVLEMNQVDQRREGGDLVVAGWHAHVPAVADIDQGAQVLRRLGIVGEELRQLGHRADVAHRLVLHLDGHVEARGQIEQAIDRRLEICWLVARIAQMAEHAQPRRAQHGGDVEGMRQGIIGRTKRRIEGEVDLGVGRRLAGGRPFQRDLDIGLVQRSGNGVDLVERHA